LIACCSNPTAKIKPASRNAWLQGMDYCCFTGSKASAIMLPFLDLTSLTFSSLIVLKFFKVHR
jgi:hypothetical protein